MSEPAPGLDRLWKLPPLILHPFCDAAGPRRLAQSAKASLMLQGLVDIEDLTEEELRRQVVEGRFQEMRMLFYIGKDLSRWLEQCMESVEREQTLREAGIRRASFAAMLVEDPPETVKGKLESWGVMDYHAIFSRALAFNSVFAEAPERAALTEEFIRHHCRYADHLFQCRQELTAFPRIRSQNFPFEMFASGEYARLLEREWETD